MELITVLSQLILTLPLQTRPTLKLGWIEIWRKIMPRKRYTPEEIVAKLRQVESFDGKLRDELLNGEIFYTLREAQVLIEAWRRHFNAVRPHGSLGWWPPAPEAIVMPAWPPKRADHLAREVAMN